MSLINDALKKAQRQRSGPGAAPEPAGPGSADATFPRDRSRPAIPNWFLLGGGALIGVGIALAVVVLQRTEPPRREPAAASGVAPAQAASTPTLPSVSLPPLTLPTATGGIDSTPNPDADRKSGPAEISTTPAPAAVETAPATTLAGTEPAAMQPTPPQPGVRPRPTPRMIELIEAFRVTGIRALGQDSKVLMNDRVYRVGDTVEHTLGIRLTEVSASALTFEDESGATYTRNF